MKKILLFFIFSGLFGIEVKDAKNDKLLKEIKFKITE
jgi:hypothetical protein